MLKDDFVRADEMDTEIEAKKRKKAVIAYVLSGSCVCF